MALPIQLVRQRMLGHHAIQLLRCVSVPGGILGHPAACMAALDHLGSPQAQQLGQVAGVTFKDLARERVGELYTVQQRP